MALDLSQVKNRLNKNLSKGKETTENQTSFKDFIWKPTASKTIIRIVPAKWSKDFPIKTVSMHSFDVFKKYVYSLTNWGEKDPVVELKKQLYNDADLSSKEESRNIAKKITPKDTYYVPVIIRGQESKGVMLWAYTSKTTDTDLLNLLSQVEEYGDITDVMEGTDIVVDGNETKMNNSDKKYIACKLTLKRNASKLSEDSKQVEEWLTNQPDPMTFFKKYSFQEIKDMLNAWLNPETSDEGDTDEETLPQQTPVAADKLPFDPDELAPALPAKRAADTYKAVTPKPADTVVKGKPSIKSSAADKFKAVFESDEE